MNKNARLYYKSAKKLGIPIKYRADLCALEIFLGRKYYYIYRSITPLNDGTSIYICKNKFIVNQLLLNAGFPVPKAVAISKDEFSKLSLPKIIETLRFPLVAKPGKDSQRGRDVLCNIKNIQHLEEHINCIFKNHDSVQIEEFHEGLKEYRVLVLKNKVIGVIERYGASIIGDGIHTIEELIAIKNIKRASLTTQITLSLLCYDREYQQCLEDQGLSLKSIIPQNKEIKLCHTVNTSRGGDIVSCGKKIHPQNAAYLCRALRETGLLYGGFDILCEDINTPFSKKKWMIIEINHHPDTTIHELANHGVKARVTKKVLWQLILRHPLSYLYHLFFRSYLSIFIKVGLSSLILFVLVYVLNQHLLT